MKDYSALIAKIQADEFDKEDLVGLYDNAKERQLDAVAEAAKLQLRERFAREANGKFGAKQTEGQSKLEAVLAGLSAKYDLSANKVGGGVKAGGDMLAGRKYLDSYISYKNASGEGAHLALIQDEASSELMVYLKAYRTGKEASEKEQFWPAADLPQAVASYEERLKVIVP